MQESPICSGGFISGAVAAAHRGLNHQKGPHTSGSVSEIGWSLVRPCGIALSFVAMALVATLLLQRFFPYPFLFLFFPAVMASAWFGGMFAGLLAVFVSTLLVEYFFVPPFNSFAINATDGTYFAAFVVCAFIASWVSSSKKQSEEILREARDNLEIRVGERTAELEHSNAELRRSMQEREIAEQTLRKTQAELAYLSKALTMGELTCSMAHEVSQPLTAVVTNGHACLEWLSAAPPDVAEARKAADRVIRDGTRAGVVLDRIRALFKKEAPTRDWLDLNEVIQELGVLLRDEAGRAGVSLRLDLAKDLLRVKGDRVQLQQVVLNLAMNGMDAMRGMTARPKELLICSSKEIPAAILIQVKDSGAGLSAGVAPEIFKHFFTTKPQGIGMGLPISRSIVESHKGRLWATPLSGGGSLFQFTVPTGSGDHDE